MRDGKILVTGAAGFIGYHYCRSLLADGYDVVGIDNFNDYYDPALKHARLAELEGRPGFAFHTVDLADREAMEALFAASRFSIVVHLAAQAGVRYSISNPHAYVQSNLNGFLHILEGCRAQQVQHLVYASSSSVYGANERLPFSVNDNVDHPISLYAATKKSNELMAHTYAHLYGIPTTGLRFFTVYGPWGRPDMAYFKFTKAVLEGQPIEVYNHGDMRRDFTYIDDIVDGMRGIMERIAHANDAWNPAAPDAGSSRAPYRLYNIGNHRPEALMDFIAVIERATGRSANMTLLPMQAGDVRQTYADIDDLRRDIGFDPKTSIDEGIPRFVAWYRDYYGV